MTGEGHEHDHEFDDERSILLDGCVTMLAKSAALSSRKLERHWQSERTDDDHAPCDECQRLLDDLYDRLANSIVEAINEWKEEKHD